MKNLFFLLLILFSINSSYSQNTTNKFDFILVHNWSGFGRDVEIGVDKYFDKNIVHFGISHFANDALPGINNNRVYYRANNLKQRIGINLGYKRSVILKDSNIELLPKFELQIFNIGSVVKIEDLIVYQKNRFSFNSAIGLDAKVKIYKNIYLTGGVEGGIILEDNRDRIFQTFDDWGSFMWNMNGNFSIGLLYRIH